jgi:hypothetical protein
MCAQVGNQRSRGVVTARVHIDAVRNLHHQRRDLHQSIYPVPLERLGLILLSGISKIWRVSSHFHHRGVFIGPWGRSTKLEKLVWPQVVVGWPIHMAGRPGGAASNNFLHCSGLLLLV